MQLDPCPRCNSTNIKVNGDFVYCGNCGYSHVTIENMQKQKRAIAAWNTANPINDTKMEQNEALEALQRAVAKSMMRRYAVNNAIWMSDVYLLADDACIKLLINQGVLVDDDGKITLK